MDYGVKSKNVLIKGRCPSTSELGLSWNVRMVESRALGDFSVLEKDRDAKDSFLTMFGPSLLPGFSVASLLLRKVK